jgi:hypothetical protein
LASPRKKLEPEKRKKPREGDLVRVIATGALGTVVSIDSRHQTAEIDLDDGIFADFKWDELSIVPRAQA